MSRTNLFALLVFLAAVFPFVGTLGHSYVNWDDPEYVQNPDLARPGALVRIWTSFDSPQVYPMVFTSFWMERQLFGENPAVSHALNLFLHALAALLCLRFLLRLGLSPVLALGTALLFALHPTQAASVAWVSERKNVLSGVLVFACLLAYLQFLRERARGEGGRRAYVLSFVWAALALLSKTTAVTLPVGLLLLEVWEARAGLRGLPPSTPTSLDLEESTERSRIAPKEALARALRRLAPFAGLAFLLGALTIFREHGPKIESDLSLLERIQVACLAVWFYAGKLLLPLNLSPLYPRWDIAQLRGLAWFAILGVLGLGLALYIFRRRLPPATGFGLAQFVLALLPTLGLVPFGYMDKSFVADHFLYLPAWGFWLGVLALLEPWRRALPLAVAALPVIFLPLAFLVARPWADSGSLWTRVIEDNPRAWVAWNNRGQWLAEEERFEEAASDLRRAIELKPDYVEAWFNLGYVHDRKGETSEAIRCYEEAIRLEPRYAEAYQNLGRVLLLKGDQEEGERALAAARALQGESTRGGPVAASPGASWDSWGNALPVRPLSIDEYREHLSRQPEDREARLSLGALLKEQGRLREAEIEYLTVLRADSLWPEAHYNLGNLYREEKRLAEAEAAYRSALELDPEFSEAHTNLGVTLRAAGRPREGKRSLLRAISTGPENAHAQYALAAAYFAEDQPDSSALAYEAAVRLEPDWAEAHNNLGVVYARLGRIEEARGEFETAARLKPGFRDPQENRARLESATSTKPSATR